MARAIWTGVLSFGLVSIPVGLYPAVTEHDIRFHQLQRGTGDRVRYQRVNERTGQPVDYAEITKGYEIGDGQYVEITQEELEQIAPGRSRALDIHTFVDLSEVDPVYFQRSYYLAPATPEAAKPYALLREAMARARRAAVATFVMRGREYLAVVRPRDDVLVAETLFFADEVRDPRKELDLPSDVELRPQEVQMAEQLVQAMSSPWQPTEYRDTYTDRVRELIEAKRAGREIVGQPEAPRPTNVVDLMSALQASVDAARQRREQPTPAGGADVDLSTAGGGNADGDLDLDAASREELARLARELGVPGRSRMTRQQLRDAVAAARSVVQSTTSPSSTRSARRRRRAS